MFDALPEEIERIIWKIYYSIEVINKINQKSFIWTNPSNNLLNITNEIGCFQYRYSDMEKYINMKKDIIDGVNIKEAVLECFNSCCGNCRSHRFPCINATKYGNLNSKIAQKWIVF